MDCEFVLQGFNPKIAGKPGGVGELTPAGTGKRRPLDGIPVCRATLVVVTKVIFTNEAIEQGLVEGVADHLVDSQERIANGDIQTAIRIEAADGDGDRNVQDAKRAILFDDPANVIVIFGEVDFFIETGDLFVNRFAH